MDISVAVGLITAGSTIAGGVIASITTLRVQKSQMAHQASLAAAERREAKDAELRAMRRELYETLLNKFDEIGELAQACWVDRPCVSNDAPPNQSEIALERAVRSLDSVLNPVMLEGSVNVIAAAHKAKQSLRDEMITIARLSLSNAGQNKTLHSIAPDEHRNCYGTRISAKYAIIQAAAVMLQSVDPEQTNASRTGPVASGDAAETGRIPRHWSLRRGIVARRRATAAAGGARLLE